MNDDTVPEWYTIQEVADMLDLSLRQCYRYIEIGKLPTTKFSKRQMVHVSDIDTLAAELNITRRPPTPPKPKLHLVQESESQLARLVREMQQEFLGAHVGAVAGVISLDDPIRDHAHRTSQDRGAH